MKPVLGLAAAALAAVGMTVPGVVTIATTTSADAAAPASSPLALQGPNRVVAYSYDGNVYGDIGLNLAAPDAPFEIRSHRTGWDNPISTVWHSPGGEVPLPAGLQTSWGGLDKFIRVKVTRVADGKQVLNKRRAICLNSWSTQRTNPDAPLRSPYPQGCPFNPFTIGSVQGIQQGWVSNVSENIGALRLEKGKYDVTASITPRWTSALGISATDATRTYRLVVKRDKSSEEGISSPRPERHARASTDYGRPAATKPTQARAGAPVGPQPDLQSLPAFGMELTKNKKYLRFSATVWNAGDSPMVVDGFRRGTQDIMDAYQYFIDADGNQTGYQQVGTMIWHQAKSHNHWHFEDFARYRLLNADQTEAVRSRKESFCLANTDAVDYTVPGADWKPENTDLHTSCGDRSTISLREVLASGSGDTYAQFRAGQSFRVDNLPNGVYYIAVEGNPDRNLVESDTTNNVALRKIKLGGTPTKRKLKVFQVGVIEENGYGAENH